MLVDQYGNSLKFAHAAIQDRARAPVMHTREADIEKLIPMHDRKIVSALSRRLYTNHYILRAVAKQKADYSIGDAFHPIYMGESDKIDGDEVSKFLRGQWYQRCEVRGGLDDFGDVLRLASIGCTRDGDAFIFLTESKAKDWPMIQLIPAHRVNNGNASDNTAIVGGRYNGKIIRDGIIYAGLKPIAYRVQTGDSTAEFIDVPARSMIHIMEKEWAEQGRGFPEFTHALESLKHCLQSTEYERIRQMIISMIGLVEHNETGGAEADMAEMLSGKGNLSVKDGITYEEYAAGTIRYFKANSGAKLEQLKHETPGVIWTSFQDRLAQEAVNGADWAGAMIGKHTGQGTAERAEIIRVRRTIVRRQTLMKKVALRCVSYAYAYLADMGELPTLENPFAWDFTTPPRLTLDDGKEAAMAREGYKLGITNLDEIIEGQSVEDFLRKRATHAALALKIKAEVEAQHGVTIDARDMKMMNPNEAGTPTQSNETETKPDENAQP